MAPSLLQKLRDRWSHLHVPGGLTAAGWWLWPAHWPWWGEVLAVVGLGFGWFVWLAVQSLGSVPDVSRVMTDADLWLLMRHETGQLAWIAALLFLRGWRWPAVNGRAVWRQFVDTGWRGWLVAVPGMYATVYAANVLTWDVLAPALGAELPSAEVLNAPSQVSPAVTAGFSVLNGAYEELLLCGYLLKVLRPYGATWAVGLSLLVRLSYHTYQSPLSVFTVCLFGVVVTLYHWHTRQLGPVVAVHAITDWAAFS